MIFLENYPTNSAEICAEVVPHALVCAKNVWCDGVALRARNLENHGKIPRKSTKITGRGGAADPPWDIFQFCAH